MGSAGRAATRASAMFNAGCHWPFREWISHCTSKKFGWRTEGEGRALDESTVVTRAGVSLGAKVWFIIVCYYTDNSGWRRFRHSEDYGSEHTKNYARFCLGNTKGRVGNGASDVQSLAGTRN